MEGIDFFLQVFSKAPGALVYPNRRRLAGGEITEHAVAMNCVGSKWVRKGFGIADDLPILA